VAIALNIREPEAIQYCKEYWKLMQHHSLNWVYEQVKDDIVPFVKLYISAKVARMGVEQVTRLLEIANNDLQSVEYRCERLKRDLDSLEADNRNSARIFQDLTDHMATMRKRLDSICRLPKRNVTTSRFARTKDETRGHCKTTWE
jgi:hypothetical protein